MNWEVSINELGFWKCEFSGWELGISECGVGFSDSESRISHSGIGARNSEFDIRDSAL